MPNARYQLTVDFSRATVKGRTASDGRFHRDISDAVDLTWGDPLELTCWYATGDEFRVTDEVH